MIPAWWNENALSSLVVMKGLIALWLTFLVVSGNAQYTMRFPKAYYLPENWPRYTLKLSERGELKDVFDAGLRPFFRPSSFDASKLEFKHARITVRQPDGLLLPEFEVDYAVIAPHPSGLSDLVFTSHALTLQSAKTHLLKWLPLMARSTAELDNFLEHVKRDPFGYNDRDFGASPDGFSGEWKGKNKEVYVIWVEKAYSDEVPIRICFAVRWVGNRTLKERTTFFDGPIPSPEGYENYKIEAGKNFGPDDMGEMMHSKGIPFGKNQGLGGILVDVWEPGSQPASAQPKAVLPANSKPSRVTADRSKEGMSLSMMLVIFGLLAALVGTVIQMSRTAKARSRSDKSS